LQQAILGKTDTAYRAQAAVQPFFDAIPGGCKSEDKRLFL
jgi:hypothetical protein